MTRRRQFVLAKGTESNTSVEGINLAKLTVVWQEERIRS